MATPPGQDDHVEFVSVLVYEPKREVFEVDSEGVRITRLLPREHRKMLSQQQVSGDEEQGCSTGQTELCSLCTWLKDNEAIMGEQQAAIAQLEDANLKELENFKHCTNSSSVMRSKFRRRSSGQICGLRD